MCARVSLCSTVAHNTAQNSSDNFPSYPPDNHHTWDGREGGGQDEYPNLARTRFRS